MPVSLHEGDCLDVLKTLPDQSVDSVVTDPPYGLAFMCKKWDYNVPAVEIWQEVLRVLKPGGHLLSFAGTRTYHRMVVAIEDAGFEIRDQIGWLYGSGFPKSLDVSKAIDKAAGAEREVVGLKTYGEGATYGIQPAGGKSGGVMGNIASRSPSVETSPATPEAAVWNGWGTALKPAWEPIVLARKPLIDTVEANVRAYGTGAMNIAECRVHSGPSLGGAISGSTALGQGSGWNAHNNRTTGIDRTMSAGRWPANVIHDGSDEVMEAFGDPGSAARFYYCAKPSKSERAGTTHPTVKPISLMRYLCKLVTPPGGMILDPFAGTGTTGQAAVEEGFSTILIEREAAYCKDIRRRLALYLADQATGRMPLIQLGVA